MPLHVDDLGKVVSTIIPFGDKSFYPKTRKYFREYTEVTGIHGLRFVSEKRSRPEKIVWVLILAISIAGFGYMTYEVLQKFANSPVVISFATQETPLHVIPFPAVTICPELKVSPKLFDGNGTFLENEGINKKDADFYLNTLCQLPKRRKSMLDNEIYQIIDRFKLGREDIFQTCWFSSRRKKCERLFTPIIIDQGVCYSFNILDKRNIFRNHVYHYADYYNVSMDKYNNEYNIDGGYNDTAQWETYPIRAGLSGADDSLKLILRYFLKRNNFITDTCLDLVDGFRILLHNPWEVPRLSKEFVRIPVGKAVTVAVQPELTITSESARNFHPNKRRCYMSNERPLQHFQNYTQSNCLLECETNISLEFRRCVAFYMPRNDTTPICGSRFSYFSFFHFPRILTTIRSKAHLEGRSMCDCLPSCTQLKYNVQTSSSDYEPNKNMSASFNYTMLQIYFKEETVITIERAELYGISDLISNFGGLLGLFTGFSLISLAEIVYFCSLRLYYNRRLYGNWSGEPK